MLMLVKGGCVYIITNKNHSVLYTGSNSDLITRIWQHQNKYYPYSFSARYNCSKLVFYKFFPSIEQAIAEEYRIKGGNRKAKIDMIEDFNPQWDDLYDSLSY